MMPSDTRDRLRKLVRRNLLMEALLMLEANGHALPECKKTVIKWREHRYEKILTKAQYNPEERQQELREIDSVRETILSLAFNQSS